MTISVAKITRAPSFVHIVNPIITGLIRLGLPLGPAPMVLLTVRGRKFGQPYTTPVGLFEVAGKRYLFSTFGEVNWVQNLRANGEAMITRGRHQETLTAVELSVEAAAPISQVGLHATRNVGPDGAPATR